jgi:hypothetical protein
VSDKELGPKLVVDNEPLERKRFKLAERRVKARNPKHTYDDVLAEFEAMKKEELEGGN